MIPVRYFVILSNGQRFGPADATLLSQWAKEGRLDGSTTVEEEGTGRQMTASMIPGIILPSAPTPAPAPDGGTPYGQPQTPTYGQPQQTYGQPPQPGQQPYGQQPYAGYNRPISGDNGQGDFTTSIVLTIIGFFCCIFLAIGGLIYANKAAEKGHPSAQGAKIAAIIVLSLHVIGIIFYIILFAIGVSSGGGSSSGGFRNL